MILCYVNQSSLKLLMIVISKYMGETCLARVEWEKLETRESECPLTKFFSLNIFFFCVEMPESMFQVEEIKHVEAERPM